MGAAIIRAGRGAGDGCPVLVHDHPAADGRGQANHMLVAAPAERGAAR